MRALVVVAAGVIVTACSKTSTSTSTSAVDCALNAVTVAPPSATLHPGDTLRASAKGPTCPPGPATTFRWQSSDTAVAIVDSVAGLIRAKSGGTATVIASATANRAVQGALALQVVP